MPSSRVAVTPPMLADIPGLFDPLRARGLVVDINTGPYPMPDADLARFVGDAPVALIGMDHVGEALVKLGALTVTDGPDLAWQQVVGAALDAGLTADEVLDALIVLAPIIGRTRVMAVAPKLALATGFDVAGALEAR